MEETAEDEWAVRLNLVHLHDANARIEMFRGIFKDDKEASKIEVQRDEVLERLNNSPTLLRLDEKQRRHILRGDKMMLVVQDDVIRGMGKDVVEFRAFYRFLSAHVHSFSLAFHRMSFDERGRGTENRVERNWTTISLGFLSEFLSQSILDMTSLFPDIPDPRLQLSVAAPDVVGPLRTVTKRR